MLICATLHYKKEGKIRIFPQACLHLHKHQKDVQETTMTFTSIRAVGRWGIQGPGWGKTSQHIPIHDTVTSELIKKYNILGSGISRTGFRYWLFHFLVLSKLLHFFWFSVFLPVQSPESLQHLLLRVVVKK